MRWLAAVLSIVCAGCWGGDEFPCAQEVMIEGSRWTHPSGDQLYFENGRVIFQPASGFEVALEVQDPPADFVPIDCRFGSGRPAAHAVRLFSLDESQGDDILRVRAQDGLQFTETTTVVAVLEFDEQNNVRRNEIVLTGSVDAAGTTLLLPLTYPKPLRGSVNVSVVVQLELTFVDEDGARQRQATELNFNTNCFEGDCGGLSSYPPVACL